MARNHNRGEHTETIEPRIRLIPFDEIETGTDPAYAIKRWWPRIGLIVVWGPPKSGKSFWTLDAVMHIALGWEYRGCRVQQGAVIYVAAEGASGLRNRIQAFRQERMDAYEGPPVPFYLCPVNLDLIDEHVDLIASIRQLADPVVVVIDTLNRTLRGSESSDEDMTAFIRAADAIRDAFQCAVVVVHHCGIDASRPRSHTSLGGAVDAQIAVKRDTADNIVATVEWMKDGLEGETMASRLAVVKVGTDDDGDPISSCVVEPAKLEPTGNKATRLKGDRRIAMDALEEILIQQGKGTSGHRGIPNGAICANVNAWRTEFYARKPEATADAKRKAFGRALTGLREAMLIGYRDDLAWKISADETPEEKP